MPTNDDDRNAARTRAAAQRKRAEYAENASWVIAGIVMIVILQTQWKPQSDWTVAIKWIVLMSPIYYVTSSMIRIIRIAVLKDDDRW